VEEPPNPIVVVVVVDFPYITTFFKFEELYD
jgi:hypothetical protein